MCFRDNVKAWVLEGDGTYTKKKTPPGEKPFCSQTHFMSHPSARELLSRTSIAL
jgi:polyphosphate kinase